MAKAKTRNVLMTTMSILSNVNVNYYYELRDGRRLFCNGISSLEPGSKYFLSKYRIDEIVVVGTEETIKTNDVRVHQDVKSIYENIKESQVKKEMRAYELYKMRIAGFLSENGQIGEGFDNAVLKLVAGDKISDKRKKELVELYHEKCSSNPFFLTDEELKDKEGKSRSPWNMIEKGLRESINKDFEQTEQYKRYLDKIDSIKEYQEAYWKNFEIEGNADKVLEALRKDNALSFIEKEYCCILLQKKINEAKLSNTIVDLKTDIANLEKENSRLQYEIDSIKNNRYTAELTYVKYIAYCELPKDNRLVPYIENIDKEVAIRFVAERIGDGDKYDNINGIVNALYGISDDGSVQDEDDETEIRLYIDMQGGNRTSSYVRNAIISILNNQLSRKVKVEEIIGINFIPGSQQASEIVDETKRYRIMDLVSGMNSFIRYGKADMIKGYYDVMIDDKFDEENNSSKVGKLINNMVAVDEAISLCNMQALGEAIVGLSSILEVSNDDEQKVNDNFINNVFDILKDGIQKDYGKLLELQVVRDEYGNIQLSEQGDELKEIDYLELIDWCVRKGFLQQALTLIEDKMPIEYAKKKILTYNIKNTKDEEAFLNAVGPTYETRKAKKYFENITKEVYNNKVKELIWKMLWRIQRTDNSRGENEHKNFKNEKSEEAKNLYIKRKLKLCIGCTDDDFAVNEDKLTLIINQLSQEIVDSEFIRLYCRFRNMSYDLDRGRTDRNLTRVANLYDLAKEKIDTRKYPSDEILYGSILAYVGSGAEFIDKEQSINGKPKSIMIIVNKHNQLKNDYIRVLDETLLLHDALKQERNCSNHASERGIRLPKELIIKAINIYVKNMRIIMERVMNK